MSKDRENKHRSPGSAEAKVHSWKDCEPGHCDVCGLTRKFAGPWFEYTRGDAYFGIISPAPPCDPAWPYPRTGEARCARGYVLLHPDDCDPPHGLDLAPGSRDSLKVEALEAAFRASGFDKTQPALVGYPLNGRVQLTSGTHRHEAARRAGIMLPVTLRLRSVVEAAWGTPAWEDILKDIAVEKLESVPVREGGAPPGLDERVDLARDVEPRSETALPLTFSEGDEVTIPGKVAEVAGDGDLWVTFAGVGSRRFGRWFGPKQVQRRPTPNPDPTSAESIRARSAEKSRALREDIGRANAETDRLLNRGPATCAHPPYMVEAWTIDRVPEDDIVRWCAACGAFQTDGEWRHPHMQRRESTKRTILIDTDGIVYDTSDGVSVPLGRVSEDRRERAFPAAPPEDHQALMAYAQTHDEDLKTIRELRKDLAEAKRFGEEQLHKKRGAYKQAKGDVAGWLRSLGGMSQDPTRLADEIETETDCASTAEPEGEPK